MKFLLWFSLLTACSTLAQAEVVNKTRTLAGMNVQYRVVLPNGYDAAREYPAVLAFPGGGQSMSLVGGMIQRNWKDQAEKRGYIVIVPAAPEGRLFFQGGEKIFPEFFRTLLADYKIEGGRFHIAGVSNGGISAMHIAAMYPEYVASLTGFPGYLQNATPQRVEALSKMCIFLHVGEQDLGWREEMETQYDEFAYKKFKVRLRVEKGEDHIIGALADAGSARLFDQFDQARKGCSR